MAINLTTVASRLSQIRKALDYSVQDVEKATGLDKNRLLGIEEAELKPSGDEILILAAFYDCDFRALIDEKLPAPAQQTDILFRRYGESFTAQDRRAVQEFLLLCQIETSLESALGKKPVDFNFIPTGTYYKGHGQQAAEALRALLHYKDIEVPRDVYTDFRSLGIHVFRRKLANDDISGLYIEDPIAGHCVLINYNEDIYRQRFSVAHEVAHAIFDSSEGVLLTFEPKSTKYARNDFKEIRANSFSSNYLMPRSMLSRLPKLDKTSALHWAQQFRVSTAALAKALKDAELIDEHTAQIIKSVRVSRDEKIDPEAPNHLTPSQLDRRLGLLERGLSHHYVDLCFRAHENGIISTGRLAEVLRIDHSELAEIGTLYGRTISHGL